MKTSWLLSGAAVLLLAGCAARVPVGPSVMVLPGSGKSFDQFQREDDYCRYWAAQRSGVTPAAAANDTAVTGAAVGTVLGAAAGAPVGAAAGDPAMGAAAGAGLGLLGGATAGADRGGQAEWDVQHRYDVAYMQCMYAHGNQVPIPGGSRLAPPRSSGRLRPPPPPPGRPPPPPPDSWR